jgi:hypothetical protein
LSTWQLGLGPRPGLASQARLLALARSSLGLSREEAQALWARLPMALRLAQPTEPQMQWLRQRFEELGLTVTLKALPGKHPACLQHPRLACESTCLRCQQTPVCAACSELGRRGICLTCERAARRRIRFRRVRITMLLAILLAVIIGTLHTNQRIANWERPLRIAVLPISAGAEGDVRGYLDTLAPATFDEVAKFVQHEGELHQIGPGPLAELSLGPKVEEMPPPAPDPGDRSALRVALWSLELRTWAWRLSSRLGLPDVDVRIFALFHPAVAGSELEHSLGMRKGRIAIAHLFASEKDARTNNVVIAHEMLHTLGATDKYDEQTLPLFPAGYAEPARKPRLPQIRAEIMAGRIPISETMAKMPESLDQCVIGPQTAREIGW